MHTSVVKQRNIRQSRCTLPPIWERKRDIKSRAKLDFPLKQPGVCYLCMHICSWWISSSLKTMISAIASSAHGQAIIQARVLSFQKIEILVCKKSLLVMLICSIRLTFCLLMWFLPLLLLNHIICNPLTENKKYDNNARQDYGRRNASLAAWALGRTVSVRFWVVFLLPTNWMESVPTFILVIELESLSIEKTLVDNQLNSWTRIINSIWKRERYQIKNSVSYFVYGASS